LTLSNALVLFRLKDFYALIGEYGSELEQDVTREFGENRRHKNTEPDNMSFVMPHSLICWIKWQANITRSQSTLWMTFIDRIIVEKASGKQQESQEIGIYKETVINIEN
jgi:hypothetical protein